MLNFREVYTNSIHNYPYLLAQPKPNIVIIQEYPNLDNTLHDPLLINIRQVMNYTIKNIQFDYTTYLLADINFYLYDLTTGLHKIVVVNYSIFKPLDTKISITFISKDLTAFKLLYL